MTIVEDSPSAMEDDQTFEYFWEVFPRRHGVRAGKKLARAKWAKLSLQDKRAAYRGAKNYAAFIDSTSQYACDASKFLNQELWSEFAEKVKVPAQRPSWLPAHAVPDGQGGWVY